MLKQVVRRKGDDIGGVALGLGVFQRRERQIITTADFAAGERGIVVVAAVNPVVFALDTELGRRILEADIDTHGADAVRLLQQLVAKRNRHTRRQQRVVGHIGTGAGDDQRRAELMRRQVRLDGVVAAHTNRLAFFHQDFLHRLRRQHGTAGALDDRHHRLGNFAGAAHRKPATAPVVGFHQRMHAKRRLRRRQAVVAPLRGQQRL